MLQPVLRWISFRGDGYIIFLYDENGALVDTHPNTGTATFTFNNLAVIGKSYRILFRDNTCTDPTKCERDNNIKYQFI